MTDKKTEALKLALEALEMWCPMTATYLNTRDEAIAAIKEALAQSRSDEEQPAQQEPTPTFTTGHCKEKAKAGGCQLHNIQCGFPACDRKEA